MEQDTVRCALTVQKLLQAVRGAPGGGIHRADLEQALARGWPQIWPTARGLYGRGLVDFCGPYLVAVTALDRRTRLGTTPGPEDALPRDPKHGSLPSLPSNTGPAHPVLVPQLADRQRAAAARPR